MPDDPVQQVPKSLKEKAIETVLNSGMTIIVLIVVSGFLGWYLYKQIPERDKVFLDSASERDKIFLEALAERDKRFIEYRAKAEERNGEMMKALQESTSKEMDRLERVLSGRISSVEKHGQETAKKVDAIMP